MVLEIRFLDQEAKTIAKEIAKELNKLSKTRPTKKRRSKKKSK
jgi:hypothetical protein